MRTSVLLLRMLVLLAFLAIHTWAASAANLQLIPFNKEWRYNQSGTNLTGTFQAPAFNDTNWPSGPGLLGFESGNPYPYPIQTTLTTNSSRITFYFRTHFQCPVNPAGYWLILSNYVDDGLVLHLNGTELYRVRMDPGAYNHLSLANTSAVEGVAVVLIIPATNLVQGDNILAAEVHQSSASSSDVLFGLAAYLTDQPLLPDLVLWGPSVTPSFQVKTFGTTGDCEVNEGCGTPGERRLMRFATETRNLGTADLFLGDPVGNPQFHYDACHRHYHFGGFAAYRLRDSNEVIVATGHKVGFCLLDGFRWNPAAGSAQKYSCGYQGIQWGWADVYGANLDCQFVDITGIAPGRYILELEIDPDNRIVELNESNNITRVTVDIPAPCSAPPTNDAFTGAQSILPRTATVYFQSDCATRELGEPEHVDNAGGHSMWFRWTPNYTGNAVFDTIGSGFDTLLAVYRGTAVSSLILVGEDDDSGGNYTSRLTANVTSGTQYRIAVDGWGGASGPGVLSINAGGNNAFASCIALTGLSGSVGGSTTDATRESNEPLHAGNLGGHSIWYCWTAPAAGRYFFDTIGSRFDTLLAVYTGNSVGSLTPVAADDDAGSFGASKLSFVAQEGATYRIAIDGKDGAAGLSLLNWRPEVRISSLQRNGPSLELTISGAPGDQYLVYTSFDLTHWTPWQNLTNTTGLLNLSDTIAVNGDRRFYWARLLQ